MVDPGVVTADGVAVPRMGFGTFQLPDGGPAYEAVRTALEAGYRHLDTAATYGNEGDVGRAVRDSGLDRDEVFVTTKVPRVDVRPDRVRSAVGGSLERLGLDRVDLVLLHWPTAGGRIGAWERLLELVDDGMTRLAGVSNFLVPHLTGLAAAGLPLPPVNQIELHPFVYGTRRPTVDWCRERDIVLTAYSPLARTRRFGHEVIVEIAEQTGLTPAQVHLRWALEHGFVPIPKSSHPDRLRENLQALEASLDADAVARLDELDEDLVVSWDPSGQP